MKTAISVQVILRIGVVRLGSDTFKLPSWTWYVHVYEMLSIAHEVLNFIRIFLSQVKLHHTARTFLQCPMQQITYFECRMKLLFSLAP